jgi:hypothetical protein
VVHRASMFLASNVALYLMELTRSMEPSPTWEAASSWATQEFRNILWTPKFYYVFIKAVHWSLSWPRLIQPIPPHPVFVRSHIFGINILRANSDDNIWWRFIHRVITPCHKNKTISTRSINFAFKMILRTGNIVLKAKYVGCILQLARWHAEV